MQPAILELLSLTIIEASSLAIALTISSDETFGKDQYACVSDSLCGFAYLNLVDYQRQYARCPLNAIFREVRVRYVQGSI